MSIEDGSENVLGKKYQIGCSNQQRFSNIYMNFQIWNFLSTIMQFKTVLFSSKSGPSAQYMQFVNVQIN